MAIPHGLAGSTGRDFDGRFWQSIMNTKRYKSPNEKSRPVGGAHGFGPFGLIQKIPPGQIMGRRLKNDFDDADEKKYLRPSFFNRRPQNVQKLVILEGFS